VPKPKRSDLEDALRRVVDPEVHLNIWDLGLVYELEADDDGRVDVTMTLTTEHCPLHGPMKEAVEQVLSEVPGVTSVDVDLVFDPPWSPDLISDEGKELLGLDR